MSRFFKVSVSVIIVAFWAVMTGWLVQANWSPGNAPFSEMPPLFVFRQVLKHEVASSLGIYRGQQRIGTVNITPVHAPADSVSFDGNIVVRQLGGKPESYSFSLRIDLEHRQLQPQTISLRFSRRQPPLNAFIEIQLASKKVHYRIRNGDFDPGLQELPLSGGGLAMLAPGLLGLPPLPMAPGTLLKSVECQANRASFVIRGERMDGYRVTISAAGLTATATMGQLGELFILRTSTEYHLLADGLEPGKYLH